MSLDDHEKISVLCCTNKYSRFFDAAVRSILSQSYPVDEIVLVINCASSKDVERIIARYQSNKLFKIFETSICQLAYNLNFGLDRCSNDLVLRMDDDDISEQTRVENLVRLMKEKDADVVGSQVRCIDENGLELSHSPSYPVDNFWIRFLMPFKNSLVHPSVLFRKPAVLAVKGYSGGFVSEDYDLWLRLMRDKAVRFNNSEKVLLRYRIHPNQSKGSPLAYSEVCGYMARELFLMKSPAFFLGFLVSIGKVIYTNFKSFFKVGYLN